MRFTSALALGASAALLPHAALAREASYRIDVRAADVATALSALATQTGVSFAFDGGLPRGIVRPVRGTMTIRAALDRMLDPLGLQALGVGGRAFRIVARRAAVAAPPTTPIETVSEPPPRDIVVTARKQSELASMVAGAVAVYQPGPGAQAEAAATTRDVARAIVGLTLASGGPGRERLFIRGVADSPVNGFTQSTVSVQYDDTRISFDGVEPGLRLADVARVEVLKGPQGPLYGTGALGGVYRIVTNRPVLGRSDAVATIGLSSRLDGAPGFQGDAMINLPIVADRLAVRAVGYTATDTGWIDDVDGRRHVNRVDTGGFRASARIVPSAGWTIDLSALHQATNARDTQYLNLAGEDDVRDVDIAEPRHDRIRVYQATIAGSIAGLPITFSTGTVRRNQSQVDDASAIAQLLGFSDPVRFFDGRGYQLFDHEVRLASKPGSRLAWVTGASFLLARSDRVGVWLGAPMEVAVVQANRRVTEAALYADGSAPLGDRFRLGLGVRVFRAAARDDRFAFDDLTKRSRTLFGVTPNMSIAYDTAPDSIVYARVATAFRPGGLDPTNVATRRFEPDNVRTFDLGARFRLSGGGLSVSGDVFATTWRNVQADYIEPVGLIATHNVGRATIYGAEASVDWQLPDGWRAGASAILQHPRLVADMDGIPLPRPARLPVVPDVSARLSIARDMRLDRWSLSPTIAVNVTGATRLGLEPELDRETPGYAIAYLGASARRDRLTLRFDVDNLLDTRADTSGLGNPFSFRTVRERTPYRPRTLSLSATRSF